MIYNKGKEVEFVLFFGKVQDCLFPICICIGGRVVPHGGMMVDVCVCFFFLSLEPLVFVGGMVVGRNGNGLMEAVFFLMAVGGKNAMCKASVAGVIFATPAVDYLE